MNILYFKQATRTFALFVALLLVGLQIITIKTASAAVNAQFSLTPASQSVQVGSDVVLNLDMNTGGNAVLAWKTTINYSTSAFSSVTVTPTAGSHFGLNPGSDVASGGVIKMARYATSSSSTNATMATITLRSSAVGNTSLSFAHACSPTSDPTPCSAITDSTGVNLISALNNGSVTVSALPVASTTKPKSKVAVKTPAAAATEVVQALTEAITPSSTKTESTRSAVRVTVVDQKNKPVEGAMVTLQGISETTNSRGEAIISELLPGNAKGQITFEDQKQAINLIIESGTSIDDPQTVKLTFQVKGSGVSSAIWVVLLLLIATIIAFIIRRRRGGSKGYVTIVPDKNKPKKEEVFKPKPIPSTASVVAAKTIFAPVEKPEPKPEPIHKPEPKPETKKNEPKSKHKPTKIDSIKSKLGFVRHKPMDPGTIIRPDASR